MWDLKHEVLREDVLVYPYHVAAVAVSKEHFFIFATDGQVRVLRNSPPYSELYRFHTAGEVVSAQYCRHLDSLVILEQGGELAGSRQVSLYALPTADELEDVPAGKLAELQCTPLGAVRPSIVAVCGVTGRVAVASVQTITIYACSSDHAPHEMLTMQTPLPVRHLVLHKNNLGYGSACDFKLLRLELVKTSSKMSSSVNQSTSELAATLGAERGMERRTELVPCDFDAQGCLDLSRQSLLVKVPLIDAATLNDVVRRRRVQSNYAIHAVGEDSDASHHVKVNAAEGYELRARGQLLHRRFLESEAIHSCELFTRRDHYGVPPDPAGGSGGKSACLHLLLSSRHESFLYDLPSATMLATYGHEAGLVGVTIDGGLLYAATSETLCVYPLWAGLPVEIAQKCTPPLLLSEPLPGPILSMSAAGGHVMLVPVFPGLPMSGPEDFELREAQAMAPGQPTREELEKLIKRHGRTRAEPPDESDHPSLGLATPPEAIQALVLRRKGMLQLCVDLMGRIQVVKSEEEMEDGGEESASTYQEGEAAEEEEDEESFYRRPRETPVVGKSEDGSYLHKHRDASDSFKKLSTRLLLAAHCMAVQDLDDYDDLDPSDTAKNVSDKLRVAGLRRLCARLYGKMVPLAPEPRIACLLAQSDVVPRHALLRLRMVRDDQCGSPSNSAWAALVEGAGNEDDQKNEGAGDEDEHKNEERDGTMDYLLRALEVPTPTFELALLSDGVLATEAIQQLSQSLPEHFGSVFLRTLLLRTPFDEAVVAPLLQQSRTWMERTYGGEVATPEKAKLLRICRLACLLLAPNIDGEWDELCQMLGSVEECRRELWAGLPHLWGHERHQRRLLHTVYHRGGLDVLQRLLADLVCNGSLPLATALVLLDETRNAYGDEADMCEARGFEERCAALAMDRHPCVPPAYLQPMVRRVVHRLLSDHRSTSKSAPMLNDAASGDLSTARGLLCRSLDSMADACPDAQHWPAWLLPRTASYPTDIFASHELPSLFSSPRMSTLASPSMLTPTLPMPTATLMPADEEVEGALPPLKDVAQWRSRPTLLLLVLPFVLPVEMALELLLGHFPDLLLPYARLHCQHAEHWHGLLLLLLDAISLHPAITTFSGPLPCPRQPRSLSPPANPAALPTTNVVQRLDIYISVLNHLLTVATGEEFLTVLPSTTDTAFHLPFMERAFQHSAPTSHLKQCVRQQAMSLLM